MKAKMKVLKSFKDYCKIGYSAQKNHGTGYSKQKAGKDGYDEIEGKDMSEGVETAQPSNNRAGYKNLKDIKLGYKDRSDAKVGYQKNIEGKDDKLKN